MGSTSLRLLDWNSRSSFATINYDKKYISIRNINQHCPYALWDNLFRNNGICAIWSPIQCQSKDRKMTSRFKKDINNGGKVWDRSGQWVSENRRAHSLFAIYFTLRLVLFSSKGEKYQTKASNKVLFFIRQINY